MLWFTEGNSQPRRTAAPPPLAHWRSSGFCGLSATEIYRRIFCRTNSVMKARAVCRDWWTALDRVGAEQRKRPCEGGWLSRRRGPVLNYIADLGFCGGILRTEQIRPRRSLPP